MVQDRPDALAVVDPGLQTGSTSQTGALLDLHEELAASRTGGCARWPKNLRLRSSQGELVLGRCGSSNLCEYCAKLVAVENSEMLALDALDGDAPALWAVLTTRTPALELRRHQRALAECLRVLRKRWPDARYASLTEYTTGYGPNSGGQRRPHWNLLLKGIPASGAAAAEAILVAEWCKRVDALPAGQYLGAIADDVGLVKYLALHFQKASQKPPPGFKGQRFNCSVDYFSCGTRATARRRAKESLQHKRALWRAIKAGQDAHDAELSAHLEMKRNAATTWELTNERGARLAGDTKPREQLHWRLFLSLYEQRNARNGTEARTADRDALRHGEPAQAARSASARLPRPQRAGRLAPATRHARSSPAVAVLNLRGSS